MAFPLGVIQDAWDRQDGKCASCCKTLVAGNRDYGTYGAWHAHHRKPLSEGGTDTLRNCVLLCINEPENCHWNVGHGGIGWYYYAPLSDSDLPCLYAGR